MMDEENEIIEEEEEDLSDPEDSLEDYLTDNMDEAVPWMTQYETQARRDNSYLMEAIFMMMINRMMQPECHCVKIFFFNMIALFYL